MSPVKVLKENYQKLFIPSSYREFCPRITVLLCKTIGIQDVSTPLSLSLNPEIINYIQENSQNYFGMIVGILKFHNFHCHLKNLAF